MAHTYLTFEFGNDEEKAQQARHKLESLKAAFKLDKKMLYKFDRKEDESATAAEPAPDKAAKSAEPKSKEAKAGKGAKQAGSEPAKLASSKADIKMILRVALPNHEKLTEQRLFKRISEDETLKGSCLRTVRQADKGFAEVDSRFEELE